MFDQVAKVIDEKIRPFLVADGGDIELIEVKDKVVKVKLKGACAGCPGARITLSMGVQKILKNEIPEIDHVEAV